LRSFYGTLGLRPAASDEDIKAAFRKLAKQYHPDLHAGDKSAEERFKEINEAYAILSGPGARARYDATLSQRRSLRWQRSRRAAAITAASFALTVTLISTAIVAQQYGNGLSLFSGGWPATEPPAAERRRAAAIATTVDVQRAVALPSAEDAVETDPASPGPSVGGRLAGPQAPELKDATPAGPELGGNARVQETDRAPIATVGVPQQTGASGRLRLPDADKGPEKKTSPIEPGTPEVDDRAGKAMPRQLPTDGANWASYRNARFGFSLRYPADIFALEPAQSDDLVKHFRSRDGRATMRIAATSNAAGRTLAQYRTALIEERYRNVKFDYAPQRPTWFVLSGVAGDDIFYERVTFACDRRSLHGWMLVFPASERTLYEPIIEEMHRTYRHSNGPGARCGAMKAQTSAGATTSSAGAISESL
jgi:DnaJ-like protein